MNAKLNIQQYSVQSRTPLVRFGFPTEGRPITEAMTGKLYFFRQQLYSPSSWYRYCSADSIISHIKKKKRKFACKRGIFITLSLLSWDSNGSSLMQFCSTLSYRCEQDVQFKQMSHAEIARRERKAWKHLHNPWTEP